MSTMELENLIVAPPPMMQEQCLNMTPIDATMGGGAMMTHPALSIGTANAPAKAKKPRKTKTGGTTGGAAKGKAKKERKPKITPTAVGGGAMGPTEKKKRIVKKSDHPAWADMCMAAVKALGEKGGSSVPAIKKYLAANYKIDPDKAGPFLKRGLKAAVNSGKLVQAKGTGMTGSFKLGEKGKGKKKAAATAGIGADKKPKKTGELKKKITKKPKTATTGEKKQKPAIPKKQKPATPKKQKKATAPTTKKAAKMTATPAASTKKVKALASPKKTKGKKTMKSPKAPKPKTTKAPRTMAVQVK